jgi:hypothetical protein
MALRSTQPLTEMSAKKLQGGKEWPARKTNNLDVTCEWTVQKMRKPLRLTDLWASTACIGIALAFAFTCC